MRKPSRATWLPELQPGTRPLYLALVDAIAGDIQSGRLSTRDRLPTQRELAQRLRLNYATVSRAYGEAQRRGLIYSRVGQGSFVCRPRVSSLSRARGGSLVDMTMNLPPEPEDPVLLERLEQGVHALRTGLRELLRYQEFGGSLHARKVGTRWLARVGLRAPPECVLICPGAQSALVATLSLLAKPGDVVVCEDVTYPGVRAVAAQHGIRLIGLPMDAEGITPASFADACAEHHPKLLYCNPTLQNPTTTTVSLARRRELVRIARQHGLAILEDDAYGVLPSSPTAPFAKLAPDITFYVAGFAKCLGAGLRVAYLAAPNERRAAQLASILRATTVMASPITVALATHWVEDGTAEAALLGIRAESAARQRMVAETLTQATYHCHPEGFHVWLEIPDELEAVELAARMHEHGVYPVAGDAFCVGRDPPRAVRICLGGHLSRADLQKALLRLGSLLQATCA